MRGKTPCLLAAAGLVLGLLAGALTPPAGAVLLEELRDSVQELTLANGLRILVVERHDAPVFSYATCVDAGGVCEVTGKTGIAHMFEHMAFKGTETIGTSGYAAERGALEAVDDAWDAVMDERHRGADADSTRLAGLVEAFKAAREAAREHVVSNEFSTTLEENGARGMNAFTGTDITCYFYSLPSNRLELCMRMEGDRLAHPVLREFYMERDVVRNERRSGTESSPVGRLIENFLTTAFMAHPYKDGVIGHSSDIEIFHRRDAWDYYRKHYVGGNMTLALVGDVRIDEVRHLAERYLGEISDGPDPNPVMTIEPVHTAERRVIAEEEANPMVIIGWQSPGALEADYPTMELLMNILGSGRSSRLYERLVKEEQVATRVGGGTGYPGSKYPHQAVVFVTVTAGQDPEQAEALVHEEIERLIEEGPTAEELGKVKTQYLANDIRQLRQPSQLALQLAIADQLMRDWRRLFDHLDAVEAVSAEDIQRVAGERLVPARRTVAMMKKKAAAEAQEKEGGR